MSIELMTVGDRNLMVHHSGLQLNFLFQVGIDSRGKRVLVPATATATGLVDIVNKFAADVVSFARGEALQRGMIDP